MTAPHSHWSSRLTFIMASAGAAIGLGNIWRFPYITGLNGGGEFVLIYLLFVILLGVPLMASEVLVGRRGQKNPSDSFRTIAHLSNKSRLWWIAGAIPILTGYLILSYYSVIAGWVLEYIFNSFSSRLSGVNGEQAATIFNQLLSNPVQMLFWDTIIVSITIAIVAAGLHRGLEKAIYIMFPSFIILTFVLIAYAVHTGSFMKGLSFLFEPDFSKITANSVLIALGQAFFSLGIGTGIMLTYGTYVTRKTSIPKTTVIICASDTLIALIAGMTIFPIVFANGLSPNVGPSLIFKTLPVAFGQMQYGYIFSGMFFIMLEFAALTSAIALLEPMTMFLQERFGWSRFSAATRAGFFIWILSLGSIASFNMAENFKIFGKTFFDFLDYATSNILLPLGGILVALFTGWAMYKKDSSDELRLGRQSLVFRSWRFAVRYLAPVGILAIFSKSMGIF